MMQRMNSTGKNLVGSEYRGCLKLVEPDSRKGRVDPSGFMVSRTEAVHRTGRGYGLVADTPAGRDYHGYVIG